MPDPTPRALNEALAQCFGWKLYPDSESLWMPPGWQKGDDFAVLPDYLTWEGMGVVLEEMRGRGYKIVTYSQNAEGRSPHYCRVSRADDEDDFMIAGERGTTLPEAAALAALAALESEG